MRSPYLDIDPNNQWIGYGQEVIGHVSVTEAIMDSGSISLEKIGEALKTLQESTPTGMVVKEVETKTTDNTELSLLTSMMKQMTGIIVMLFVVITGLFIYLVIAKTR